METRLGAFQVGAWYGTFPVNTEGPERLYVQLGRGQKNGGTGRPQDLL